MRYEGFCGICRREIGTGHTRRCWYWQRHPPVHKILVTAASVAVFVSVGLAWWHA